MRTTKISSFIGGLIFLIATATIQADSETPQNLRQLIESKNAELEQIQSQREALEKNLETINRSGTGLKKELQIIDSNISQLNLFIKSNNILLEKLELEIESLGDEVINTENDIQNYKETVGKLMVELQIKDRENMLVLFLKNRSLADSVAETQNTIKLNNNLTNNIEQLRKAQVDLNQKLGNQQAKKVERRNEQVNLLNRQYIIQDQKTFKNRVLTDTKNQERIYEQQIDKLEKLQRDISEELEKVETELRKTIDPNLLPIPRPGVLLWPIPNHRITQGYGSTPFALKNYKGKHHNGVDFGMPIGTEVFAAEDGTVINVSDQDAYRACRGGAYGKLIVIKHNNGLTTLYAHLSKFIVSIGQEVKKGDVIGYVGRTGWATGPHLHFTVFASQTLTPARSGFPEGTTSSRVCGPMPVGGDLDPVKYL